MIPFFVYFSPSHLESATLPLDVASRQIKFQEKMFIHASVIRIFPKILPGSEIYKKKELYEKNKDGFKVFTIRIWIIEIEYRYTFSV